MYKRIIFALTLVTSITACEQKDKQVQEKEALPLTDLPFTSLTLDDLNDFQNSKGSNWFIVGDAYADRNKPKDLQTTKGTGILTNLQSTGSTPISSSGNLLTKLEHGDIDLELDFMMPKGSSSGLLLQSRYEVQLNDSWLKDSLSFEDCGGIHGQEKGELIGKAPAARASKAPGLWQHLKVSFKAPQFDETGKKVADARFVEVVLNGIQVQKDVTVSAPTLSASVHDEKALAPLMLQGDGGPIAFKNIRYKIYDTSPIVVDNIQYKLFDGRHYELDAWQNLSPTKTGKTDTLSHYLGDEDEVLVLEGHMQVPRTGDYLFKTSAGGPVWLVIDDSLVVQNEKSRDFNRFFYGKIPLKKGSHNFKLAYSNSDKSLVLHYQGPGRPWTELTTFASQRRTSEVEPLELVVKNEPILQRGFLMHQNTSNPYATSVGIPGGVNYAYDLNTYSLLNLWHGKYIDVSNMWRERGEKQLEIPLGASLQLQGLPTVAILSDEDAAWPDSVSPDNNAYTNRGYKLNSTGLPVFFYTLNKVNVEDKLEPTTDKAGLMREISFQFNEPSEKVYCLLTSGKKIEKLPNGSYAIDEKNYYLENILSQGAKPIIRKSSNGDYQMLLQINPNTKHAKVKYSIIW